MRAVPGVEARHIFYHIWDQLESQMLEECMFDLYPSHMVRHTMTRTNQPTDSDAKPTEVVRLLRSPQMVRLSKIPSTLYDGENGEKIMLFYRYVLKRIGLWPSGTLRVASGALGSPERNQMLQLLLGRWLAPMKTR